MTNKLFNEPDPGLTAIFQNQYKTKAHSPHGWRVVCWGTAKILIPEKRFCPSHHFIQHFMDYQAAVAKFFATLDRENIPWQKVVIHDNGSEAYGIGEYWQVTLFNETRFK